MDLLLLLELTVVVLIFVSVVSSRSAAKKTVQVSNLRGFKVLSTSPEIGVCENWLSADECSHLIELANPLFRDSTVINHKDYSSVVNKTFRSSTTAFLEKGQTEIVRNIEKRVAKMFNTKTYMIEALQVVKYLDGQQFQPHYDYFLHPVRSQRIHTVLVYLNNVPEQCGGATIFPKLSIRVTPEAGKALYFRDASDNGQVDDRTLHGGEPIHNGIKYALNIWVTN